jgi:peptidoglycan-N-acetylglucosamine deacetylase
MMDSPGWRTSFQWPEDIRMALSLSFDDARPSQLETALPILDEYGVKGTFYAVPAAIENDIPGWRAAAEAGHEIGNHTVNHPCSVNFPFARGKGVENYSLGEMARELTECNRLLEAYCGVMPRTFAYPCGNTFVGRGRDVRSYVPLVAERFIAGRGYPSERPTIPACCDLAQVNGCVIDQKPWPRVMNFIAETREEAAWLCCAGHDVAAQDAHQTTRTDILRKLIEYALEPAHGIWTGTVAEIACYIAEQRNMAAGTAPPEQKNRELQAS